MNKDGELVISSTKTRTQKYCFSPLLLLMSLLLMSCQNKWFYFTNFLSGVILKMLWGNYRYLNLWPVAVFNF